MKKYANLETLLNQSPYQAYSYTYPHKSAYRLFEPPQSLREVWANEDRRALFLYIHIPFCEMRCGFCNLFTLAKAGEDFYRQYVKVLSQQAKQVSEFLGEYSFSRFAMGGGTPTYLDESSLMAMLDMIEKTMGIDIHNIPASVEVSPETATFSKLSLLAERGVDRISIGIQSFIEVENRAIYRRQKMDTVIQVLERIRHIGFPTLNIDLIYGIPGQNLANWLYSLREVLRFQPQEIYLYPLYIRPLTGLELHQQRHTPLYQSEEITGFSSDTDIRLQLYWAGRDFLLANGYQQISMRLFQSVHASNKNEPVYCCQEDGMVGLGSGARSYTNALHYSTEYAVSHASVKKIIIDYCQRSAESFRIADYGIVLDENEQKRRYLIKSILRTEGLNFSAYYHRFNTDVLVDFPEITELLRLGLNECDEQKLTPTDKGLAYSDVIGFWLVSEFVKRRMENFLLR
jgi:oxygen-independent coproporphyrinogen-3 oxidase